MLEYQSWLHLMYNYAQKILHGALSLTWTVTWMQMFGQTSILREFNSLPISVSQSNREHLPCKICKRVPVRTPVLCHWYLAIGVGGLDIHWLDGASTCNIGHEHEIEVVVTVDCEPHPTTLHTWNPAKQSFLPRIKYYMHHVFVRRVGYIIFT